MFDSKFCLTVIPVLLFLLLVCGCSRMEPLDYTPSGSSQLDITYGASASSFNPSQAEYDVNQIPIDAYRADLAEQNDIPYDKGTYIDTGRILYRPVAYRFAETWAQFEIEPSEQIDLDEPSEYVPVRIRELEEWKQKYDEWNDIQKEEWDALHQDPPLFGGILQITFEVTNLNLSQSDLEENSVNINALGLYRQEVLEKGSAFFGSSANTSCAIEYCDLGNPFGSHDYFVFHNFPGIGNTAEVTVYYRLYPRDVSSLRKNELIIGYTQQSVDAGLPSSCKVVILYKDVEFVNEPETD